MLGILLAYADYQVDWKTGVLIMLTCVSLQILSNLSNELGDVIHGTDSADRVGPQYGLNSGVLTIGQMKGMVAGAVVACPGLRGLDDPPVFRDSSRSGAGLSDDAWSRGYQRCDEIYSRP